jgi:phosphoribosylanthranilate isomerase
MSPEVDLLKEEERYFAASALLVDAYQKGVPGGTGQSFDWGRVPVGLQKPIVLAGGLTPENVEQAIKEVSPWAVDVSGGVERAKGVKDLDKLQSRTRTLKLHDQQGDHHEKQKTDHRYGGGSVALFFTPDQRL